MTKTSEAKTKHTPGPWVQDGFIVDIAGGNESLQFRCKADAALVAAAPTLLEILKEIYSYYPKVNSNAEESEMLDRVQAAIAKATNE